MEAEHRRKPGGIAVIKSELSGRVAALVRAKAPESATLEYKSQMYSATEGGRKEFAKDLSGFANRDGGLILIGIREKDGNFEEAIGVPIEEIDNAIQWLESVARSGVTPHIPGLGFSAIETEGCQVLVASIPRGSDQPYEVASAGTRFFVRDERSVRTMSREEIKFAVRREADLFTRVGEFVDERWERFIGRSYDLSQRLSAEQHGALLIVTPIFDETFTFRFNLPKVIEILPHYTSFDLHSGSSPRPRLDGIEYTYTGIDDFFPGYTRIYRHGIIEVADGYVTGRREGRPLPGLVLMKSLIASVKSAVEASRKVTGADLYTVDFRIKTAFGTDIAFFNDPFGRGRNKVDREYLIFDRQTVSYADDINTNMPYILKPLLDQIWQAFGYVSCGYFDQQEKYVEPR
ncbi:helix-turn-helix domain-containing protein [Caulobacter sp.]|uniref:AlbA family DNA-binding domain-containing protein n=1 Tax=Caulobacter sp. TaxID=78 RepID=UPI003BAE85A2